MNIIKKELLGDVNIGYSSYKKKFTSRASLQVDGYVIEIKTKCFETIDAAFADIKERISVAVVKFVITKKE